MKETKTTFTCDHCSKQIEVSLGGYPYSEGLEYLYNLSIKIGGVIRELKDKHFCCLACLNKFVTGWLKNARDK